jgi:hypothetical protein
MRLVNYRLRLHAYTRYVRPEPLEAFDVPALADRWPKRVFCAQSRSLGRLTFFRLYSAIRDAPGPVAPQIRAHCPRNVYAARATPLTSFFDLASYLLL